MVPILRKWWWWWVGGVIKILKERTEEKELK